MQQTLVLLGLALANMGGVIVLMTRGSGRANDNLGIHADEVGNFFVYLYNLMMKNTTSSIIIFQ